MRKLLVILGMLTCMAGLCACGKEEAAHPLVDEAGMIESAEYMIQQMNGIVSQGSDMIEQYSADPVIYAGLTGLQSAMEDIGTFNGTDGGEISYNDDEVIVRVNILGSDHNAVVELIFDDSITTCMSIATNVTYSLGEDMTKAALNTVLGMGTVFVVLIFISLIISCFGVFNKIGDKKQKEEKPAAGAAADPIVEQIAQKEELAGDAELVAVIAAAVAAYEGSASTDGFVVRSIRKSNKSKWQNV